MRSCCALFPFTQYSYRWGETPAEFTAPALGGDQPSRWYSSATTTTWAESALPGLLVRWLLRHSFRCLAFVLLKEIGTLAVEDSFFGFLKDAFWITKRRRWERQQGRSREEGRAGRKKTRGGGVINSGRRTFVPNVLGLDPRPPLLRWSKRVAARVLCSRKISTGRQKVCTHFFLTALTALVL
jgi:hypothetical protein